jgi:hypothetical protein
VGMVLVHPIPLAMSYTIYMPCVTYVRTQIHLTLVKRRHERKTSAVSRTGQSRSTIPSAQELSL